MVHAETFNGIGRVVDENNNWEVFLEAFGKFFCAATEIVLSIA
jgi:hypothetical protein